MHSKDCHPKCRGICNKNYIQPIKSDKACDPRCRGSCNRRSTGTSTPERKPSAKSQILSKREEDKRFQEVKSVLEDITAIAKPGEIGFVIMNLDAIILDIDTVYEWVIRDIVEKFGIPKSEINEIIALQHRETFRQFCTDYNLRISPQDTIIEFKKIAIKNLARTPLMPGIEKLLNYFLKNHIEVAVATTSTDAAFKLKTHNYTDFFRKFNHVMLAFDLEANERKPSSKMYENCRLKFSSKPAPNQVLVLEDTPEGIIAAGKAGMYVAWFPNKYMNRNDGKEANAVFNSLKDFKPELFGLPSMN